MGLCPKIIDFIRFSFLNDSDQVGGVCEVTIVENEISVIGKGSVCGVDIELFKPCAKKRKKMRSQNTGYLVLNPKIKNRWPHSKQKNTKKLPDTPIKRKE